MSTAKKEILYPNQEIRNVRLEKKDNHSKNFLVLVVLSKKCPLPLQREKNEIRAYPKETFMIASLKLEWKQDFSPNEYCKDGNVYVQTRRLAVEYKDSLEEKKRKCNSVAVRKMRNAPYPYPQEIRYLECILRVTRELVRIVTNMNIKISNCAEFDSVQCVNSYKGY